MILNMKLILLMTIVLGSICHNIYSQNLPYGISTTLPIHGLMPVYNEYQPDPRYRENQAKTQLLYNSIQQYPATCPSYPGWYGPFGHVGYPCPSCHY